jgi:hypothetical protein
MNDDMKAHIPATLLMSPADDRKIRNYCIKHGVSLGGLALVAILEYIERDKR